MMKKVRITAVRKVQHEDLMAQYENPTEHACDVTEDSGGYVQTDSAPTDCVLRHGSP